MEIFCIIYYVLSYVCVIPQIVKLIKTKSSNDYSLLMLFIQLIGVISWTIYILISNQTFIVCIGAIIDLLLLTLADSLVVKYYKFNKKCIKR